MGVGLELAVAVDLLCGEYGAEVGFYDLHVPRRAAGTS